MKNEEPESMKEIHRIREKLYEESKDMSPEEQAAHDRSVAEELIRKYGIRVKTIEKASK